MIVLDTHAQLENAGHQVAAAAHQHPDRALPAITQHADALAAEIDAPAQHLRRQSRREAVKLAMMHLRVRGERARQTLRETIEPLTLLLEQPLAARQRAFQRTQLLAP